MQPQDRCIWGHIGCATDASQIIAFDCTDSCL